MKCVHVVKSLLKAIAIQFGRSYIACTPADTNINEGVVLALSSEVKLSETSIKFK
jgi:hypothetical protein